MKITRNLLLLLIICLVSSCSNSPKKQLEKAVEKLEEKCPLAIPDFGYLDDASYDEDDNVIEFDYVVTDDEEPELYQALFEAWKEDPTSIKDLMLTMMGTPEMKDFRELMAETDASLICKFKLKYTGDKFSVRMSADEINGAGIYEVSPSMRKAKELDGIVGTMNSMYPQTVEEGLVIENITDDGEYFVFNVIVDEDLYDLSLIEDNKEEMKREMLPEMGDFSEICQTYDRGVIYRYRGNQSGNTIDIVMEKYELM